MAALATLAAVEDLRPPRWRRWWQAAEVVAAVSAPVLNHGTSSVAAVVAVMAAVAAPVVNHGSSSVTAVMTVVVAAVVETVQAAVAAIKELEAPVASAGLTAITTRPITSSAAYSSEAAATTDAAADCFTVILRRQMWRRRRTCDYTCKRLRSRQDPVEVDLPQSMQAVGRASAGDGPESTLLPHWSVAIPCGI